MARRAAFPGFLVLLAVLVAAGPALAQQPKRGGVIRIAEREAPGLDPHLIDQLPHPLLREPQLQPARALPQRARAEDARPTSRSCPTSPRSGRCPRTARSTRSPCARASSFHNKPPVNGREVTAEDVKYSLERFMAKSGFRDALRAGAGDRRRGPLHRAHHAQGAVRAVPEPPGQPELLRDPAARGRGEVQGLQPSRRRHRHRALRAEVLREGRAQWSSSATPTTS